MVKLEIGSAESKINAMKLAKSKCINCVGKDINMIQGLCLFIHSAFLRNTNKLKTVFQKSREKTGSRGISKLWINFTVFVLKKTQNSKVLLKVA